MLLGKGVDAPDLPTVKDFTRFYAPISRGKIVELPTVDCVNPFAEWFFAGFTRVTGTPTIDEDRSKVYNVSYYVAPYMGSTRQDLRLVRNDLVEKDLVVNVHRPKTQFYLAQSQLSPYHALDSG
jgi:hypothetical protein